MLRAKTGELFAFRCDSIVRDVLWHWILVPVDSLPVEVPDAFEAAQKNPVRWLSIVEDRRGEQPRMVPVWMTPEQPIPV